MLTKMVDSPKQKEARNMLWQIHLFFFQFAQFDILLGNFPTFLCSTRIPRETSKEHFLFRKHLSRHNPPHRYYRRSRPTTRRTSATVGGTGRSCRQTPSPRTRPYSLSCTPLRRRQLSCQTDRRSPRKMFYLTEFPKIKV